MFTLPKLPYSYEALEPHIDARTMEIHYTKHHQGYTDKLNAAIENTELADKNIEDILSGEMSPAVRNNGGGFYNHNLFWSVLSPDSTGKPEGEIAEKINEAFGSFEKFQEEFSAAAGSRFGSGWTWLIKKADGTLKITSTPNQDNPLMSVVPNDEKGTPILGLDVWEHAYYLNYQNKRPDYVSAFWNIVNWNEVFRRYQA